MSPRRVLGLVLGLVLLASAFVGIHLYDVAATEQRLFAEAERRDDVPHWDAYVAWASDRGPWTALHRLVAPLDRHLPLARARAAQARVRASLTRETPSERLCALLEEHPEGPLAERLRGTLLARVDAALGSHSTVAEHNGAPEEGRAVVHAALEAIREAPCEGRVEIESTIEGGPESLVRDVADEPRRVLHELARAPLAAEGGHAVLAGRVRLVITERTTEAPAAAVLVLVLRAGSAVHVAKRSLPLPPDFEPARDLASLAGPARTAVREELGLAPRSRSMKAAR